MSNHINILNRRAKYDYNLVEKFVAGIQLTGTEIKSIRDGKVNLGDAYCTARKGEAFVHKIHIAEYNEGSYNNHEPMRTRKLLLNKREIKKLISKTKEKGLTIIPVRMFISDRGFAKLEIALASGKKSHDKRHDLKEKDAKREIDRQQNTD